MPTANELYDLAVDLRDQGNKPEAVANSRKPSVSTPALPSATACWRSCTPTWQTPKRPSPTPGSRRVEPNDAFSYTALSVIYQRCGRIAEAEHAKAMAWEKQMGYQ